MQTDLKYFRSGVKRLFNDELRANGFFRKGDNWYRIQNDISKHVNLQSAFGDRFYVNVSISTVLTIGNHTVVDLEPSIYGRWSSINRAKYEHDFVERFLQYREGIDSDSTIATARVLICDLLLPFLDQLNCTEDLNKIPKQRGKMNLDVSNYLNG